MWLEFFKECMVSLIFQGINLLFLSTLFFWSQLKLWSASQQCFDRSFVNLNAIFHQEIVPMWARGHTAISTTLHPPKVWEPFVDDIYSILKPTHLRNLFHHINNLHQNIKFTMEEESNGELVFLDTFLKWNIEDETYSDKMRNSRNRSPEGGSSGSLWYEVHQSL